MSCITNCFITEGYNGNDCFDNVGGVQEIYLAPYCQFQVSGLTYSNATESLVTGYTASVAHDFYIYTQPEEVANWVAPPTVNKQNNTLFFEQQITFKMADWDASVRDKFLLLAKGKVVAIAKNNKGNFTLLGREGGLSILSGEMNSGTAFEDGFNVTVTLSAKSALPPVEVAASVINTDINPVFV
jgi:hypothetical protein